MQVEKLKKNSLGSKMLIHSLFVFLIVIQFGSLELYAQKLSTVRMTVETRYDNLDWGRERNRIQAALRTWLTVDLGKSYSLVTHLSSGSRFQSRWSTATNFDGKLDTEFMDMYVRQLFVQLERGSWRYQLGVIPPIKNVASRTGLEPSGWVDGARIVYKPKSTLSIETVVGGISRLNEPNAFTRKKTANFAELEINYDVNEELGVDASTEILDKNTYQRLEFNYDKGRGFPTLLAEGMYNVSNGTWATGISAQQDLNEFMSNRTNSGLRVRLFYAYIDENIGLRGTLSDDFYAYGHSFTVEAEGPLWRKAQLNWFARQIFMSPSRTSIGIRTNIKFPP